MKLTTNFAGLIKAIESGITPETINLVCRECDEVCEHQDGSPYEPETGGGGFAPGWFCQCGHCYIVEGCTVVEYDCYADAPSYADHVAKFEDSEW